MIFADFATSASEFASARAVSTAAFAVISADDAISRARTAFTAAKAVSASNRGNAQALAFDAIRNVENTMKQSQVVQSVIE